jgi:hypothetical protein
MNYIQLNLLQLSCVQPGLLQLVLAIRLVRDVQFEPLPATAVKLTAIRKLKAAIKTGLTVQVKELQTITDFISHLS